MAGLTLGVEEEYQLLDAGSGELVSRAAQVLAAAPADAGLTGELPLSQVEAVTPVCATLGQARAELRRLRSAAVAAAAEAGCLLAAASTSPQADWRTQSVNPDERYAPLLAEQVYLARVQLIAGMHVHVGVADRDLAIRVVDQLRPRLPVLTALTGNSPYWLGVDTGHASYRTVHWARWPVSGPPPRLGSWERYEQVVADLVATGVVADPNKVYWDARPSRRFPTVEVRSMDVCLTLDEAVTTAGLVRALVDTAVRAAQNGGPPPDPRPELLRAASWQAARYGTAGRLVDLTGATPQPRPASDVIRELLDHVRDALDEAGDTAEVADGVAAILARGCGAQRQRAAYVEGGLAAATALVVRETVSGLGIDVTPPPPRRGAR